MDISKKRSMSLERTLLPKQQRGSLEARSESRPRHVVSEDKAAPHARRFSSSILLERRKRDEEQDNLGGNKIPTYGASSTNSVSRSSLLRNETTRGQGAGVPLFRAGKDMKQHGHGNNGNSSRRTHSLSSFNRPRLSVSGTESLNQMNSASVTTPTRAAQTRENRDKKFEESMRKLLSHWNRENPSASASTGRTSRTRSASVSGIYRRHKDENDHDNSNNIINESPITASRASSQSARISARRSMLMKHTPTPSASSRVRGPPLNNNEESDEYSPSFAAAEGSSDKGSVYDAENTDAEKGEERSEAYEEGRSEIYHGAVKKGPGVNVGAGVRNERKSTDKNEKKHGRGEELPPKTGNAAAERRTRTTLRQKHPHTASVRDVVVDVVDRIGAVLRQSKMSSSSRKSLTEPVQGKKNEVLPEDDRLCSRECGDIVTTIRTASGLARCGRSHGSSTCFDPIGSTESSGILGSPLMREDKNELLLHSPDMVDMCNENTGGTRSGSARGDDDTTELVAKVGDLIDILHWDRLKGALSIRIRPASPSFGGEVPYETTVPDVALQLEGEIARGMIHEPDGYYYPPHTNDSMKEAPKGGTLGGSSPSNHNKNHISAAPFKSLVRILDEVGEFYEVDLGSTTRRGLILKTAVLIAGEPALNDTAQMKRLRGIEAAPLTSQIQPSRCSRRNVQNNQAGAQTGSAQPRSSAVSSYLLRTLVFPLLRLCGLSYSFSPRRKRIKRDLGKGRDSIPAFGRFASNGRAHRSWAFGGLGYYMQLVTSVPAIVLGITGACLVPNGGTNSSSSSSTTVATEWDQELFVANILASCCGALFLLTHVETSLLSAFTCARRTKCGGPRTSLVRALFALVLSVPLYLSPLTIVPAVGYTVSGICFFISSCCGEVGEISGPRRVHMEYWKLTHHYEEREEEEEEGEDEDDVVKSDVSAAPSWFEKEHDGTKNSSALESRTNPETDVEAPMDDLKTTLIRSEDDDEDKHDHGDGDDDLRKSMGSGTHWSRFKIWFDRHRLRSTFPSSLLCVFIWLLINSVLFLTKYQQEMSPPQDVHPGDQAHDEMHQVSGFTACARGLSNVLIFNLILAFFLICPTVLRKLNRLALGDGICAFFFSWIPLNGKTAIWHKRVGSIIFIFSVAHMWSHIMAHMHQAKSTRPTGPDDIDDFTNKSTSGALAMIALCLICAGAQGHVRRTMHSLFLFTHIGGMAILLLALVFHIPKSYLLLLSPPLFLYLYDMRQRSTRHDKACVKLLEVTYAQCMLELTFAAPWRYRAGQYVWLHCPLVSKYEWHPFSISSSSESEVLRVNINIWPGGWTEGVRDFVAELIQESEKRDLVMREKINVNNRNNLNVNSAHNLNLNDGHAADGRAPHRSSALVCDREIAASQTAAAAADRFRFETKDWLTGSTTNHIGRASWDSVPLFLFDGPHPAPMMHYPKFETILLIGAGIGVTPMNAVLEQLIEHVWGTEEESEIETRHAYAVWLCPYRDVNSHRWFAQRLSNFDTTVYDHHSRLAQTPTFHYEMHTFVTSTNPKSEASGSRDMFPQVPKPEPVIMDSFRKDRRPIVKRFSDDHLIDAMLSPATPSSQFQAVMSAEEHQRDNALGHVHVWNERPFWGDIFSRIRARHSKREKHRVGVFYAGAPQIGLHLQRCARKFSDNTITFRVF